VNVTVSPASGTGSAPTGDVSLLASTGFSQSAVDLFTLSSGSVAQMTYNLPGGNFAVTAHYAGDATYAPQNSAPVTVAVSQEQSTTGVSVLTVDSVGNIQPFTSGPFGSFVYLRADVAGVSRHGTPTGNVTFNDTFSAAIPGGNTFSLNTGDQLNNGSNTATPNGVYSFDTGTHTISAAYAGDGSFLASSSMQSVTFSIQPGFFAAVPSNSSSVVISAPGGTGTSSVSVSSSTGFSGTIALACSGLPAGAACVFSPASIMATGTATTATSTITVTTGALAAKAPAGPQKSYLAVWTTGMGLMFSIVFLGAPKRRRLPAGLLGTMVLLLLSVLGCGGGSSHTTSPPPPVISTPAGSYNVTVSATSGSNSSVTGFTLFVN
jgi:hypothetical protein